MRTNYLDLLLYPQQYCYFSNIKHCFLNVKISKTYFDVRQAEVFKCIFLGVAYGLFQNI